ncbi:MAG: hypothetical protein H0V31_08190 [Acidobacteria bacterium]|nr:hypothetical protein [Acidobacteriota bacterium]
MAVDDNKKKNFIYYASFIGVAFAIAWGGFMEYCRVNAPRVPNEASGRIYPKNYHGTIVYLNLTENILMYVLPGAGFLTFFTLVVIDRSTKDKNN